MISKSFEVLDLADLCWTSLAFVALDQFLKQKLAFVDLCKNLFLNKIQQSNSLCE